MLAQRQAESAVEGIQDRGRGRELIKNRGLALEERGTYIMELTVRGYYLELTVRGHYLELSVRGIIWS